ncbi:TPA: hypothetical protein N0F65_000934 [Lagenidium giganteum]|uniref:DegT/DnrJ/EryC1/StrS aminotransferase family protein n=1 Tax=Lagenidium giganteum TaxID=4803 RepID=A0AAV2YNH9_9STRA|nr:TPA: hypothetical protein N0F65_000934 [Lagenidium giganteum]
MATTDGAHLKPFGALEQYSSACPWAIFPRKKLDVTYADVLAGVRSCLTLSEEQRAEYEDLITRRWDPTGASMVCLSIRTGFDLLLQTLKLPKGSEVICSAITIPDMIYLIRYHELVPVPVDIDMDTLAIKKDLLQGALTKNTRAILIAHVFGSRYSMDPIVQFAEENNLLVIEDCAQAFAGHEYHGDERVDVSMFSFGTIKTATAFGGALIRVRNGTILEEMKRRESRYQSRSTGFFLKRLLKYGVLHGLSTPAIYGISLHACWAVGADHDKIITSAIRGFSGGELVSLLRNRPSMPLLGLLHRRLTMVDDPYINLRRLKSNQLMQALKTTPNAKVPGTKAEHHYYWLFPVIVPSPKTVVKLMNEQGFDVTSGATQLAFIPSPHGEESDPETAKYIMQNLVYLPVTPEMPDWALKKMVRCLQDALLKSNL